MSAPVDQINFSPHGWIQFLHAGDTHHAAFEAWVHERTRARILRFWYPSDEARGAFANKGRFVWQLRHPRGPRADFSEGADLFAAADEVLREIEALLEQADAGKQGGI